MNIPTYASFLTSTLREGRVTRGTNITPVDNALKAYWDNHTTSQKVALLIDLIKACATWFKRKQGKSDTNFLGMSNNLFVKRKTAIESLGKSALEELNRELMWGYALTAQEKFAVEFHKKKLNTLTKEPTLVKPMERSYQPERLTYLTSEKKTAVSGTGMHAVYDDMNKNGAASREQYLTPATGAAKQALNKKNVNLLTEADFRALDAYVKSASRYPGTHIKVMYTQKKDRQELMAFVDGQGRLCDVDNNPITTERNGAVPYAMDRYGNLFYQHEVINQLIDIEKNATISAIGQENKRMTPTILYNHSSFNAGNDVICAGTIQITNGILKYIDNRSGHYQPNRDNLYRCVEVLNDEEVLLSEAIVEVAYKNAQGELKEDRYHLTDFLRNKNAARDLRARR